MDDIDGTERGKLEAFLRSIHDSREETRRHGLEPPEDLERGAEEAIARGVQQRGRDVRADQSAKHR